MIKHSTMQINQVDYACTLLDAPPNLFEELVDRIVDMQMSIDRIAGLLSSAALTVEPTFHGTLGDFAKKIYAARRRRVRYLSTDFLGEPAWDLMLDFYVQHSIGKRVSITSACIASAVPPTTALRWIAILERDALIFREVDAADARRNYLQMTPKGIDAVECILKDISRAVR